MITLFQLGCAEDFGFEDSHSADSSGDSLSQNPIEIELPLEDSPPIDDLPPSPPPMIDALGDLTSCRESQPPKAFCYILFPANLRAIRVFVRSSEDVERVELLNEVDTKIASLAQVFGDSKMGTYQFSFTVAQFPVDLKMKTRIVFKSGALTSIPQIEVAEDAQRNLVVGPPNLIITDFDLRIIAREGGYTINP